MSVLEMIGQLDLAEAIKTLQEENRLLATALVEYVEDSTYCPLKPKHKIILHDFGLAELTYDEQGNEVSFSLLPELVELVRLQECERNSRLTNYLTRY